MPFSLFNSLTHQVESLQPAAPPAVSIYTCGPTVYNDQHIGNYRTFIAEDVLVKALRADGYQVKRVMNITDVGHLTSDADEGEDKLEVGAKREGSDAWTVARKYENAFLADLAALNIEVPDPLVRATAMVPQQIDLIRALEAKGHTYRTDDGIYFDTTTFPDYGKIARLDLEGQQAGARVTVREGKRHPADFALWKFSDPPGVRSMEWESPWGVGFPGWHLECSAIVLATIGPQVDVHCGGIDHLPIHHPNEIAQSESATGVVPFARTWVHAEFLLVDGGKMSKSLGNVYTVADLVKRGVDPIAFRLFTFNASYRAKLNFTWDAVAAAGRRLTRLRQRVQAVLANADGQGRAGEYQERFLTALTDDLNVPAALAVLEAALEADLPQAEAVALFTLVDDVLGLDLREGASEVLPVASGDIPEEVQELVTAREQARAARAWAEADQLRDRILAAGYTLIDRPDGTVLQATPAQPLDREP